MTARVVFGCDHDGCGRQYILDSAHTEGTCPGPPTCGGADVPMNLSLITSALMDKTFPGGVGGNF